MKIYVSIKLFIVVSLLSITTIQAQLSYAEGGPSVEDPGLEVDIELRRYIDEVNGNDSNDGKTQATAWKTVVKVRQSAGTFVPGFHILFKRGSVWADGLIDFKNHSGGVDGNRIVLGAYGNLSDPNPYLPGGVRVSKYFMVRDLEGTSFSVLNSHHSIIYNNICHGSLSNGITGMGASHHLVIMGNLIYDIALNDCVTLHATGWLPPPNELESHHWIIDNIMIGMDGTEEGVDLAMGNYTERGVPMEGDVKIVANRIQMHAVPGLSEKTGRGVHGMGIGYDGQWTWVVGNMIRGGRNHGFSIGGVRKYFNVSGNIIFNGSEQEMVNLNAEKTTFENNTMYDYTGKSMVVKIGSSELRFNKNIVLRPEGGWWFHKFTNPIEMDFNWYGHSDTPVLNNQTFSEWQTTSGYDTYSNIGIISGITAPPDDAFNHDPRNWREQAFIDQFIPSSDFVGLDGVIPGAYDKEGNRQGMAILPFEGTDLENGGLGWEGPPLVQQRLKELGISWGEPLLAKYPTPQDRANNISVNSSLSWTSGDSSISHNVYFGVKFDSLVLQGNQIDTTFIPGALSYEETYYWRVDQVTSTATYKGVLWSFSTEEEPIPPTLAEYPSPEDGEIDVRTTKLLSWESGVRTRSVKIYFGADNPPPYIVAQEGNTYGVKDLELNTKYYWRVDGVNEWGETEGTQWEFTTQAVPSLPEGWASLDIGKVGNLGGDNFENNSFTVTASGVGIKGTSDQFRFIYYPVNGNTEIIARILSVDNTSSAAMAGVMIREKLDSTSMYSLSALTSEHGTKAQWRSFDGVTSKSKSGSIVSAPYWVKLVRAGNYIVSYESADGKKWKSLKTEELKMQSNVKIGLVVTSGNNDSLCTAVFDNVSINGILVSVDKKNDELIIPKEFAIGNYPNPFNPTTTIKYSLPKSGKVTIQVYDIMGSLVKGLVSKNKNAGTYSVLWDGKNSLGLNVSSGIYFYKVQLDDQIKTAKMILIK